MKLQKSPFKLPSSIKHLLVDLDGTLLGAHEFPLRIEFTTKALSILRKHGSWFTSMKVLRSMYTELDTPSHHVTNGERAVKAFSKLMEVPFEEAHRILNEAINLLFPKMERHFYPIEGAKEFLHWAKEYYPMTLATNPIWTEDIVKLRVRWANLDPSIFQSITHSGRMHACKPAKEYYEEILKQERLTCEECVLIGNDVKRDLPATQVGIPVFIVSKNTRLQPLKIKGQKAPAWKGSFGHLQELLQSLK